MSRADKREGTNNHNTSHDASTILELKAKFTKASRRSNLFRTTWEMSLLSLMHV